MMLVCASGDVRCCVVGVDVFVVVVVVVVGVVGVAICFVYAVVLRCYYW